MMGETVPAPRRMPWETSPVPFWLTVGGAAVWILGLLLPWARVTVRIGSPLGERFVEDTIRLSGAQLDPSGYGLGTSIGLEPSEGKVVLVAAVAFAVFLVSHLLEFNVGRSLPLAMVVASAIAFLVVAVEIGDLWDARDGLGIDLDIGAGIWVTLVGTVAALAGSILYLRDLRARPAEVVP